MLNEKLLRDNLMGFDNIWESVFSIIWAFSWHQSKTSVEEQVAKKDKYFLLGISYFYTFFALDDDNTNNNNNK